MRFLQSIGCITPAAIVIYGVLALLLLVQFGGEAVSYLSSAGWEQVPGTVVSSGIEDASDTTGERYAAQVIYTYEIDGVTYEGDQLDLRGPTYVGNLEDAQQNLIPYPVGASVMPYVDPADPTNAVLERSLPQAVWVFVSVGVTFAVLFLVSGILYLVNRRRSAE